MICAIFMICILLLSITFVMYFNGRNKDIYYYYYYYYYYLLTYSSSLPRSNILTNIFIIERMNAAL